MWSRASSANRHRRRHVWLQLVALAAVAALTSLGYASLIATDTFGRATGSSVCSPGRTGSSAGRRRIARAS